MEATCFSETSIYFQRTTRLYIPGDRNRHKHGCEYLRFYVIWLLFSRISTLFGLHDVEVKTQRFSENEKLILGRIDN
jgi:hypothetical protein